jgi:hypothetical protein
MSRAGVTTTTAYRVQVVDHGAVGGGDAVSHAHHRGLHGAVVDAAAGSWQGKVRKGGGKEGRKERGGNVDVDEGEEMDVDVEEEEERGTCGRAVLPMLGPCNGMPRRA